MAEKKLNILIVGLGKGGTALIAIFNSYEIVNILGVVDNNPAADGLKLAKTLKIQVAAHWKEFLNNKDLEVVIDVTGSPDVYKTLLKEFPEHVNVISGNAAKIIWMMY
ncbi:hypothetical protein KKD84_05275 [Patescibacteria group bacterium]|nr:hypothetical protein [Patescibacteria group bacterium]